MKEINNYKKSNQIVGNVGLYKETIEKWDLNKYIES
jgi:hypothetical protein